MPESPDDIRARHKAELDVAVLEAELIELKASGDDPDKLRKVKDKLRAARQTYRENRASSLGAGDAVASPAPVQASARVKGA